MLVIPAIDLMGGEAVRLEKGDFATKTVYARHPAEKAEEFARAWVSPADRRAVPLPAVLAPLYLLLRPFGWLVRRWRT